MVATLTKGYTFTSTELLTHTKAHSMVDSATVANIDRSNFSLSTASPVHIGSSAPSSASGGNLWFDTVNSVLRMYDGNAWQPTANGYIYTNRSGSSVAAGDVVILDTANANAVKKTTSANSTDAFGVCLHAAGDVAEVVVITEGRCPALSVTGSTSIGDFLFTSTTGGKASPSATIGAGVFARALSSSATSVIAHIGGCSLVAGGSPSASRFDGIAVVTGTRNINAASATVNYAHGLSVAPREIAFYANSTGATANRTSMGYHFNQSGTYKNGGIGYDVSGGIYRPMSAHCVGYYENASNHQLGAISAVDTTNISVTWTKTGTLNNFDMELVMVVAG